MEHNQLYVPTIHRVARGQIDSPLSPARDGLGSRPFLSGVRGGLQAARRTINGTGLAWFDDEEVRWRRGSFDSVAAAT